MIWDYAYTPNIWPSVFTTFLFIVLAVFSWLRRSVPGALPFMIACLFGAAWAAGSVMEYAALDLTTKIFWVKFQAAWQLPSVTALTCFILEYTWPGRWLTKRNLALLSIFVFLSLGLISTDDLHHLMWRGFAFDGTVIPLINTGGWLLIAYGYGLGMINITVMVWLAFHSPQHRWPVALIIISQIASRGLYTLEKTRLIQSALPLDILGLGFLCLLFALALLGFRLFDPVAMARLTLMEQLRDGMLVLDRQGLVTSLNPAAERIFALPARQLKGRPVRELLPAYPEGLQPVTRGTEIEFNLLRGGKIGYYWLGISLLNDWRGQEVGRLLLLQDVTEQKRAQAQLLEQQRALAMLHERELLARELHDNLGQVLGFVSMQAQAIRKRAQGGDLPAVEAQLTRLAQVAQSAHADIRESILNLNAGAGQDWSFPSALRQYLEIYQGQYGIRTELSLPEAFGEGYFEPEAEVQLLRLIQESLTNARKHGDAGCVQVTFTVKDGLIRLLIADDGRGFDPERIKEGDTGHYGLQFMHERVEQIGGVLRIDSAPGKGTRVVVELTR